VQTFAGFTSKGGPNCVSLVVKNAWCVTQACAAVSRQRNAALTSQRPKAAGCTLQLGSCRKTRQLQAPARLWHIVDSVVMLISNATSCEQEFNGYMQ
jgi:hypothetical protein